MIFKINLIIAKTNKYQNIFLGKNLTFFTHNFYFKKTFVKIGFFFRMNLIKFSNFLFMYLSDTDIRKATQN
ncbi:TPA: hypothetical protein DEG21_03970 [Patescibacteria group bacterium]|nr:hypothetical protein [Candidatus Gracilibacteria bacterium]HBY75006.1 hypothetical protein [Candidatus Gracilibacteria bacterium]